MWEQSIYTEAIKVNCLMDCERFLIHTAQQLCGQNDPSLLPLAGEQHKLKECRIVAQLPDCDAVLAWGKHSQVCSKLKLLCVVGIDQNAGLLELPPPPRPNMTCIMREKQCLLCLVIMELSSLIV